MANTYKALQSVTVGAGGASSISFTNIPQTYTDLVIKVCARTNGSGGRGSIEATINSSSTGYSYKWLIGFDNSNVLSSSASVKFTGWTPASSATATTFSNTEIYIPNYVNNATVKGMQVHSAAENNSTTSFVLGALGSAWANTAPITSIVLTDSASNNYVQGSTFVLYGVFNADVSTAPATPTIGTATAGGSSASITFTGVSNAASYTMTSTPGSFTGTGTSSPITVSGLTNGTSYTFKVKANNPFGSSAESAASNSVTPVQPYDVITGVTGVEAWTFSNGFGTKYSAPATQITQTVAAISFAGNKSAVICGIDGSSPYVGAYAWSSGWGTKYSDPASPPSGRQLGASFWPKTGSVAFGGDGSRLNTYAWSSGFGSKYADPSPFPTGGFAVRWSENGAQLAVSNNSASPWQAVYFFSGGFGSKYADPGTLPPGATYGTAWTPSGNAILYPTGSSPFVVAYPWSSGYGSKYADPATLPSGLPGRVTNFNYAGNAWVGGGNSTDMITAYAWSSGFGTKYAAPAGVTARVGENAFFTPNDGAVIWSGQGDGTTSLAAWAWTNGSGFGSKYSDPVSPTNTRAYGLDVR